MSSTEPEFVNAHAKLSPSSSERWIACPGSVQAQAAVLAEDPSLDDSNEHSRLGTAAHALLDACLILGTEPKDHYGAFLAGKDHPPADEAMGDAVQIALDYVQEYVDTYGEENLIFLPERRVVIGPEIDITGDDDQDAALCNGTMDVLMAHRDMSVCVSIDYKHGSGIKIDANNNPQVMLYTAGARHEFGKFKKYRSVIVQPRAGKKRSVDEFEYTDSHLRKFLVDKVRPSARAAMLPNAPRVAGDHCRFCKAAPRCATYKRKTFALARVEFSPIEEPDPEQLTVEEFIEVLEHTQMIENYLHAVRAHALRMVERDHKAIPGWTLGWTRRSRLWDDEAGVAEYVRGLGIKPDEYAPRSVLSPAQMKKLLAAKKKIKRAKKGEEAENPLDAFVKYSIPNAKLVRAEDAGEDFDAIDED